MAHDIAEGAPFESLCDFWATSVGAGKRLADPDLQFHAPRQVAQELRSLRLEIPLLCLRAQERQTRPDPVAIAHAAQNLAVELGDEDRLAPRGNAQMAGIAIFAFGALPLSLPLALSAAELRVADGAQAEAVVACRAHEILVAEEPLRVILWATPGMVAAGQGRQENLGIHIFFRTAHKWPHYLSWFVQIGDLIIGHILGAELHAELWANHGQTPGLGGVALRGRALRTAQSAA